MGVRADILVEMPADAPWKPVVPQQSSLISDAKFSAVMSSIKASYPKATLAGGRFALGPTDLLPGQDLRGARRDGLHEFLADSDGFLVLISTDYDKVIGFFVPSNFKIRSTEATPNSLLAFYWINQNSELATSKRKPNLPIYGIQWDLYLVDMGNVLHIRLDRSINDEVFLADCDWVAPPDKFNYPRRGKEWYSISGGDFW